MLAPSVLAGSASRKEVSKSIMAYAEKVGIGSVPGSSTWIAKTILEEK